MAFEISSEATFSAAHYIRGYKGDCSNLHGHNWRVRVVLRASGGKPDGMTYDFRKLRACIEEVAALVDHSVLNDLPQFASKNPTAESIAEWFCGETSSRIQDAGVSVARVEVWESAVNCAAYVKE